MHNAYDEYTAASSHNQRWQQEEKHSKQSARRSKRIALLFLIVVSSLISGLMIWHRVIETISPQAPLLEQSSSAVSSALPQIEHLDAPPWNLMLVNHEHPLPEDFTVTLVPLAGQRFDYRVRDPLSRMIAAAANDDVTLIVCSGYRNVVQQNKLYSDHMAQYQADGLSEAEATIQTEQLVSYPGTSEHHLGLAVDLSDQKDSDLTKDFSTTAAYDWLSTHAADFGFIERYPDGKESVTGISWEPWHYRYVGEEHAAYIQSSALSLEEYIELQFPSGQS